MRLCSLNTLCLTAALACVSSCVAPPPPLTPAELAERWIAETSVRAAMASSMSWLDRIDDPALLARIASEAKLSVVRKRALERTKHDAALLARIAFGSPDSSIRLVAVRKIRDDRMLARIAREDASRMVRRAAIARIASQEVLTELALGSKDFSIREQALKRVTDAACLARIVCETKQTSYARGKVVDRIEDQAQLVALMQRVTDGDVRKHIARKIRDPDALASLALEDENAHVRVIAIQALEDASLLERVARQAKDGAVVVRALRKIDNQETLEAFCSPVHPAHVRQAAISKIAGEDLLGRIALHDESLPVRESAIARIRDEALLAKLATDRVSVIRRAVAKVSTDMALLARLAEHDIAILVRKAAIPRLTDKAVLGRIALGAKTQDERRAAVAMVDEPALLASIVLRADNENALRYEALARIRDAATLQRIYGAFPGRAGFRQRAVAAMVDDAFLLDALGRETSAAVRRSMVVRLQSDDALRKVALESFDRDVRHSALHRLRERKVDCDDIVKAHNEIRSLARAIGEEASHTRVLELALEAPLDDLRVAAASRGLEIGAGLDVALRARDHDVLKLLLKAIDDKDELSRLASAAAAPEMRVAASKKSGAETWEQVFARSQATSETLGTALAAVSLFGAGQQDAKNAVQQAALTLIRRGDESRIPEMQGILSSHGDRRLCEDYLNCGQPDLVASGRAWAKVRGLMIRRGAGSARARWGRKR